MATDSDIKNGMSILDGVEKKIEENLGDTIAMSLTADYDADKDLFVKELIKQCQKAEKNFGDNQEGLARASFLMGRLYGFYYQHGPMAYKGGHKKAAAAYKKALELGYDEEKTRKYLNRLEGMGGTGGCFIATAAYDSPFAEQVIFFREFRDTILLNNIYGKIFVKYYYLFSPFISNLISKFGSAKLITRFFLNQLIKIISKFRN